MKKIVSVAVCLIMVFAVCGCGNGETQSDDSQSKDITLKISDREEDVEYMKKSDLSVFGIDDSESLSMESELNLNFTEFNASEDGEIIDVGGTGKLVLGDNTYDFTIEDGEMNRVEVSDDNRLYESILEGNADVNGKMLEISIDFVASEDFSQAVATVSGGDTNIFFGDIFNDYLEYFNMILQQME